MADIALTAAQIAPIFPEKAEIYPMVAGAAITKGQAVYIDANGVLQLADASVAGTAGIRGIALNAAQAGQGVDVLFRGHCAGFTLTSQAYQTEIFLSDTTGALADAAGTVSAHAGVVVALSDNDKTKALFVNPAQ